MPKLPKVVYRKLGQHNCWGRYLPWRKLIEVEERLRGKPQLDTLLHEAVHHAFPEIDEDAVRSRATLLAQILWKEGYRRADQATPPAVKSGKTASSSGRSSRA